MSYKLYFCPSELENAIGGWVKYYNERRFHESLDNLTPKDVYLGQGEKIKNIREITTVHEKPLTFQKVTN